MDNTWMPIPKYNGYEINETGDIRSLDKYIKMPRGGHRLKKGITLKPHVTEWGYVAVHIRRRNPSIHKLLAQTFIPNPFNKPQVNHINGIKTDNRLENLEWVTCSENTQHAYDNGLIKNNGIYNANSKFNRDDILSIKYIGQNLKKIKSSVIELAKIYGVDRNTIYGVIKNEHYKNIDKC